SQRALHTQGVKALRGAIFQAGDQRKIAAVLAAQGPEHTAAAVHVVERLEAHDRHRAALVHSDRQPVGELTLDAGVLAPRMADQRGPHAAGSRVPNARPFPDVDPLQDLAAAEAAIAFEVDRRESKIRMVRHPAYDQWGAVP